MAELYYEDYFFENRDYFVEATRLNVFFFGETSKRVEKLFLYDSLNISE